MVGDSYKTAGNGQEMVTKCCKMDTKQLKIVTNIHKMGMRHHNTVATGTKHQELGDTCKRLMRSSKT